MRYVNLRGILVLQLIYSSRLINIAEQFIKNEKIFNPCFNTNFPVSHLFTDTDKRKESLN